MTKITLKSNVILYVNLLTAPALKFCSMAITLVMKEVDKRLTINHASSYNVIGCFRVRKSLTEIIYLAQLYFWKEKITWKVNRTWH